MSRRTEVDRSTDGDGSAQPIAWPSAALVLALLLATPSAAAQSVEHADSAGDVFRDLSTPVDEPAVDLRLVRGEHDANVLDLFLQIEGAVPVAPHVAAGADREYRYLWPVILDQQEGETLLEDHDLSVLCRAFEGEDLFCSVAQEGHIIRSVRASTHWINVSVRLDGQRHVGALEVGGAATASSENGTRIEAQDFTDNTVPFQSGMPGEGGTDGVPEPVPPWWRTPWILLAGASVGIAAAIVWNRMPKRKR